MFTLCILMSACETPCHSNFEGELHRQSIHPFSCEDGLEDHQQVYWTGPDLYHLEAVGFGIGTKTTW